MWSNDAGMAGMSTLLTYLARTRVISRELDLRSNLAGRLAGLLGRGRRRRRGPGTRFPAAWRGQG
jgi:hypothetical protein